MPRTISLFCILATFLIACSTEGDSGKIAFFNGISFNLKGNEKVEPITEERTDRYFELLGERNFQAPLYRQVETDGTTLYLALPLGAPIQELMLCDSVSNSSGQSSEAIWNCSRYYKFEEQHVHEVMTRIKGNTILILAANSDSVKLHTIYSSDSLINRFSQE